LKPKAEDIKVRDPDEAMARFESLLGNLVKVPKKELDAEIRKFKARRRARVRKRAVG
jgi:hypothetical protein